MQFQTPYTHQKTPPEVNSGECLVDLAGYIPAQKRIENLIMAGQRLRDYRAQQFDFPDGEIDEDYEDPTRDIRDLAEATQLSFQAEARLKQSKKASQTVPEPPKEDQNVKTDKKID
ncbi:MAG: hypothetical protein [Arizlama microvirus]|nr:MAG: hypothetical protein [Arizlama microvirus]